MYHRGQSSKPGAHWQYERLVHQLTGRLVAATFDDELRFGPQGSIDQALQFAEDIVAATA
jgi:hypothetical protein